VLRVDRQAGGLTVLSRLARLRVLVVLGGVLVALAAASAPAAPPAAAGLAAAAALLVALGGRPLRARFERGSVSVRSAVPLRRVERHALAAYRTARVETFAEARRRRAERLARGYAARSGTELPAWLRAPEAPGTNDRLRRIVLVGPGGEPLPVTAWLGEHEELEPARLAIEAVLG
jgi:hypothetical protein